jgi:hypothetical protein
MAEAEQSEIVVKIKELTGAEYDIKISTGDTLLELFDRACAVKAYPMDQIRLIWTGKQLPQSDEITLSGFGITEDTTMTLVLRLRGN